MYDSYLDLIANSVTGALDTRFKANWRFDFINSPEEFNLFLSIGTLRTFIGKQRLINIQDCIKSIIINNIPGDLIEAGCWRGGSVLFMKASLKTYSEQFKCIENKRKVWCADLFPEKNTLFEHPIKLFAIKLLVKFRAILPDRIKQFLANIVMEAFPNEKYSKITVNHILNLANILPWRIKHKTLSTSAQDIQEMFTRYDLFDENIKILQGWFKDTLPHAAQEIDKLSLLRIDADFYYSTLEALDLLYHKLSSGGYCIIDDYGGFSECKKAVDEFRSKHGIYDEIIWIDKVACYWRKS